MDASRQVLSVFRDWKQAGIPGVLDVVPAYTEVAVHFDPLTISGEALRKDLEVRLSSDRSFLENDAIGGAVHRIPVVYNGADLERVAAHTGYSVPDVTHRHAAGEYIVAMVGFLPHFPFEPAP